MMVAGEASSGHACARHVLEIVRSRRREGQAQCYVASSMQRWQTMVYSSTHEAESEQGTNAGQDCGFPAASKVWGGCGREQASS